MFPTTEIPAITHDLIFNEITPGVFLSNAFTKRLREKQKLEAGGNRIKAPLMIVDDTGTTGGYYSPRDALSLDDYEGISASFHSWKYLQETLVLYKADIALNANMSGVLELITARGALMKRAFSQRLIKGALSDGTAATGALSSKQLVGLQAVIASSGSYGSIADTDLASWVSYVDDNGGANRALTQAILDKAFDQAVEEGIGGPTVALSGKGVQSKIKGLLTPQQRTTSDNSVNGQGHGSPVIIYSGIPHMIENNMPANTLFYVDERHFKLHVQKDNNMRSQVIKSLETADAQAERVFLYANTVAPERKFHSRVNDITE